MINKKASHRTTNNKFNLYRFTETCRHSWFINSVGPICTVPRHSAPGIIPNSRWLLDNSAKKLQCALLLKFKPHYVQQASVHL